MRAESSVVCLRARTRVSIAGLLALLSGCASAPINSPAPSSPPGEFKHALNTAANPLLSPVNLEHTRFWSGFNDPLLARMVEAATATDPLGPGSTGAARCWLEQRTREVLAHLEFVGRCVAHRRVAGPAAGREPLWAHDHAARCLGAAELGAGSVWPQRLAAWRRAIPRRPGASRR